MTWTSITSGRSQACGIGDTGDLYCWGDNGFGQTGITDQGPIVWEPAMVR
ncbi:MAG: RCC1 domain-containing protein [Bdellovibrionota bacterium]